MPYYDLDSTELLLLLTVTQYQKIVKEKKEKNKNKEWLLNWKQKISVKNRTWTLRVRGEVPNHCNTEDSYYKWLKINTYWVAFFLSSLKLMNFPEKKILISCAIPFYVH